MTPLSGFFFRLFGFSLGLLSLIAVAQGHTIVGPVAWLAAMTLAFIDGEDCGAYRGRDEERKRWMDQQATMVGGDNNNWGPGYCQWCKHNHDAWLDGIGRAEGQEDAIYKLKHKIRDLEAAALAPTTMKVKKVKGGMIVEEVKE